MTSDAPSPIYLSTDKHSFPSWLAELKAHALSIGAWNQVNPDGPDAPHVASKEPELPMSIDELIEVENKVRRQALVDWAADVSEQKGPQPIQTVARFADVKEEHTYRLQEYRIQLSYWSTSNSRYLALWTWVRQSVPHSMREPLQEQLIANDELSLQGLVRALQKKYAPTVESTREYRRNEYLRVLAIARLGRIAPLQWLADWFQAYSRAESLKLPIIEGFTAKKDFLEAIAEKLAPEWATPQLRRAIEADTMGEPTRSLEEYASILQAHIHAARDSKSAVSSVYATLGGRPDAPSLSGQDCPCLTNGEQHSWPASVCSKVELALTGKTSYPSTELTSDQKAALQAKLKLSEFAKLREKLRKKGWLIDASASNSTSAPKVQYPGTVYC